MKTMRTARVLLSVLLIALLLTSTAALASTKLVNADKVVVRETPDKDGYKVGNVNQGDKVEVTGSKGEYYKISILSGKLKGQTGYIFKGYVNDTGVVENKAQKGECKVIKHCNLREYAGTAKEGKQNPIICELSKGDKVEYLKKNDNGWIKVNVLTGRNKGKSGWVHEAYLRASK